MFCTSSQIHQQHRTGSAQSTTAQNQNNVDIVHLQTTDTLNLSACQINMKVTLVPQQLGESAVGSEPLSGQRCACDRTCCRHSNQVVLYLDLTGPQHELSL